MPIEFEFATETNDDFARAFAKQFNTQVVRNRVTLPESLGTGFIQEIQLHDGFSLCLHDYTLQQPFILKRLTAIDTAFTIKFDARRVIVPANARPQGSLFDSRTGQAVELSTTNQFMDLVIPPHQPIYFLAITIERSVLMDLLHVDEAGHSLIATLMHNESFVFHEALTPDMERTLYQLNAIDEAAELAHLRYRTKVQELICLLFTRLLNRPNSLSISIKPPDVDKIYTIRTELLTDLSRKPYLPKLSRQIGMSESKMSQLFRQIFGVSIYDYYQQARLDEAARLLHELTVTETAHQLGFNNVSHFSRLFERQHQIKPKRYKATLDTP